MERFPDTPVEPFDAYGDAEVGMPEPYLFESLHSDDNPEACSVDMPSPDTPLSGDPTTADSFAPSSEVSAVPITPDFYTGNILKPRKSELERFAGIMTETFLDVVLPFDWPRSELTVSPVADINNPATEPNRKPSWHEYYESGPADIDYLFK